jgi:glucan phosphoethanolaminetransferase (alkaline phosphatase superfamily)
MWSLLKVAATAAWLILAPWAWIPVIATRARTLVDVHVPLFALLYALVGGLGVASVVIAPFLRNRLLRWTLVPVFLFGFGVDRLAVAVQGEPLSTQMLATFLEARYQAPLAIEAYWPSMLAAVALVVTLAPWLLRQPHPSLALGAGPACVPILSLVLTFVMVGSFTGRAEDLPAPLAVPAQAYFARREANVYVGPRDAVRYEGAIRPRFEKVILVVDEAVRGDYVGFNEPRLDNTPFLVSQLPILANFGIASSFSNCSTTTRVALRSGARESDLPDPQQKTLHRATMWQYAKDAGYRTSYFDTWLSVRRMSSMLTYDELRYVDERRGVPLDPYWEIDNKLASEVVAWAQRPGPAFLFVEKIGIHVPYERNLPAGTPQAPDVQSALGRKLDAARAADVRNYLAGVRLRVDEFFRRLLPALTQPGTLLIYTSDHGQSLYDGPYDGSNCTGPGAVKGEGMVPLFVFASDEGVRLKFQEAARLSRDRRTHGDIFPTLLWAMGFEAASVQPRYEVSLLDTPPSDRVRRFFVLSPFTDRLSWVQVD